MTVSLFMGSTGAIDMDRVGVSWASYGSDEQIRQTTFRSLICPNWTITGKYNLLPGRSADSDNWLEPEEQFEILACPSTSMQPYGSRSSFTRMVLQCRSGSPAPSPPGYARS